MKLTMRLGVRSYDIVVRRGALARVNQLINLNRKVLVVTDEGVPRSYVETILAQCGRGVEVCVPQGEGSKSFACLERILTTMLEAGFGRSDAVLALGGGVVGDLAGFAAACYMRGVDFIYCPTTTLILYRSLVVKKNVVENDERETGLRAVLNFGHTIGHGIESAEHLGGLYHGECVALGMLPMIEDEALRSRVKAVYKRLGLPASIEYDGDEIFRFATHDKKASGDAVTVVRVPELGQVRLDKIPLEELRTLIGEGIQ